MPITAALVAGGIGLGSGYLQAKQQNRNNQANMLANAEATRYSPWTGIKGQIGGADSADVGAAAGMGGMQGALGGYMTGKGMQSTDLANQKNQLEVMKLQEEALAKKPTLMSDQPAAASQYQMPDQGNLWARMNTPKGY